MTQNPLEASQQIVDRIKQVQGRDSGVACTLLFQFLAEQKDHNEMRVKGVPANVIQQSWENRNRSLTETFSKLLKLEGWTIVTKTKKSGNLVEDTRLDFGNTHGASVKVFDFREILTLTLD